MESTHRIAPTLGNNKTIEEEKYVLRINNSRLIVTINDTSRKLQNVLIYANYSRSIKRIASCHHQYL